jgi:hypothetical protein
LVCFNRVGWLEEESGGIVAALRVVALAMFENKMNRENQSKIVKTEE